MITIKWQSWAVRGSSHDWWLLIPGEKKNIISQEWTILLDNKNQVTTDWMGIPCTEMWIEWTDTVNNSIWNQGNGLKSMGLEEVSV